MTKEQYNEWRNHPATLFFRQFIKDRREAFIREATEWWLNNPGEFEKEKATIRGRVLEMFELEDVPFEAIELFYNERKNGTEALEAVSR